MAASSPFSQHFGAKYGHDGIFQPPKTSPSTKMSPSVATGDYFSGGARKRQRSSSTQMQDSLYVRHSPRTATPSYPQYSGGQETPSAGGFGQASFVNDRYRLAGGFDTPSLQAASLFEGLSVHDDQSYRGRMMDDGLENSIRNSAALLSGPLARERNGVARINTTPAGATNPSWTSFAFNLVGKMFTFGGSMIRGFYAGEGKGYDLHHTVTISPQPMHQEQEECSTPIPGAWDFNDFVGNSEKECPSFTPPSSTRPPNKRRQTDRDTWVMIGTPDPDTSILSPSRRGLNTTPRNNMAGRPGASRANSRRNAAPTNYRNPSYAPTTAGLGQAFSPVPAADERRASIASVRSPLGRPSNTATFNAVMSPEAERFARRQAKQERAADKAMNSMSRRLEDLIRQGQEALGTKYSVEGDDGMDEDEGFVDETY